MSTATHLFHALLRTSPQQLARFLAMFAGHGTLEGVKILEPVREALR